jgi:hypothetical protein
MTFFFAVCPVCGFGYCTDIGGDVRQHNSHHARAVAARQALAGVGPCELPLSYGAREELKRSPPGQLATEHLLLRMWSHFARSLDAQDFDLQRHPSWTRYARAYLANAPTSETGLKSVTGARNQFGNNSQTATRLTRPCEETFRDRGGPRRRSRGEGCTGIWRGLRRSRIG